MTKPTVTIFSTPTCPWCQVAKQFLTQLGAPYQDIDVSRDQAAAEQMVARSGQFGVPQLWIGESVIVGFDPGQITRLIREPATA